MINHLRTLLLNLPGSSSPGLDYPGEQYVPRAFQAVPLPGPLQLVRDGLFGQGADRAQRNYRLQQYLTCIHADANLAAFATALDPRITYYPFNNSLYASVQLGAQAAQIRGTTSALTVLGQQPANAVGNTINFQWRVDVTSGTQVTVTELEGPNPRAVAGTYTLTSGLSNPIALPDSTLSVVFASGVGSSWLIDLVTPPALGLPGVLNGLQRTLNLSLQAGLFGAAEPLLTFGNLWSLHDQMPYRLAGVVLALAYQINALAG